MGHRIQTTSRLIVGTLAVAALILMVGTTIAQNKPDRAPSKPVSKTDVSKRDYSAGDVNLDKSLVYILVDKTGLGHQHGVVGNLMDGKINLARAEEGDRIVFDMASFDADSDAARKYVGLEGSTDESTRKQVNANMRGEAVLNVKQFPTAILDIKSVKRGKEPSKRDLPQYQIKGNFTLHGTTKPITVIADADEKGEWTHLRGSFAILQSDYGITPFSKAFGAVGVADRLRIWGDFWIANPK